MLDAQEMVEFKWPDEPRRVMTDYHNYNLSPAPAMVSGTSTFNGVTYNWQAGDLVDLRLLDNELDRLRNNVEF